MTKFNDTDSMSQNKDANPSRHMVGDMKTIKYIEELTQQEYAEYASANSVVFIPCAPLEEHSSHLPLGVDAMTARFFAEKLAKQAQETLASLHCLIFPTVFAGSDVLTFRGSFETRPSLLRELLYSYCGQLARDGFQKIILVGGHGGPRHMVVLEEVAAKINWRFPKTSAVSASSRFLFNALQGKLGSDLLEYAEKQNLALSDDVKQALPRDFHAGLIETSLMLVMRPELVKDHFKSMKPATVEKVWHIRKTTAKKLGLGHIGFPALANETIGNALVEVISLEMSGPLMKFLSGDRTVIKKFRSPLYYIPIFRSHFFGLLMITVAALALAVAMIYFTQSLSQILEVVGP